MTAASDRGRNNRARGARAEVQVVNYLRTHGYPDARRYLAGDGRQPGDLDWHPLACLEVKDCAASAWPTWCRQAAAEARPGMVPMVVRRTRGVTDVGLWQVRLPLINDAHLVSPCVPCGVIDRKWWGATSFAEVVAAIWALDHPITDCSGEAS